MYNGHYLTGVPDKVRLLTEAKISPKGMGKKLWQIHLLNPMASPKSQMPFPMASLKFQVQTVNQNYPLMVSLKLLLRSLK